MRWLRTSARGETHRSSPPLRRWSQARQACTCSTFTTTLTMTAASTPTWAKQTLSSLQHARWRGLRWQRSTLRHLQRAVPVAASIHVLAQSTWSQSCRLVPPVTSAAQSPQRAHSVAHSPQTSTSRCTSTARLRALRRDARFQRFDAVDSRTLRHVSKIQRMNLMRVPQRRTSLPALLRSAFVH